MSSKELDFSARGRARVYLLTALGTSLCVGVSFVLDSYSFEEGWRWGANPLNNLLIPLVLAPPFFLILLGKLRELAVAHHELLVISSTDVLTSCFNRRAFTTLVEAYLAKLDTDGSPTGALLVIDVDHFKAVNDNHGHDHGDEALKLIAGAIRHTIRQGDVLGRMGGEEFSVFLPRTSAILAEAIAERIRLSIDALRFEPSGRIHPLSVSVGGIAFARSFPFDVLYRHADRKLYVAKGSGRNRVEIEDIPDEAERIPLAS